LTTWTTNNYHLNTLQTDMMTMVELQVDYNNYRLTTSWDWLTNKCKMASK